MEKRLVHTPEGVRDIYGEEFARKLRVQELFHDKFSVFGYKDIQTPTFEFFDVFSKEIGTTPSKELYKFFDKDGNTLVLRPDFTPSMARCAAKYYIDEKIPVRFSYSGNTFSNTPNLQGKLNEVTQMGVELIGDDSVEADAEVIALAIESLQNAGLKNFQISIGEVDFFKGICEEVNLDEETEEELRTFISNKNYFGAEELLSGSNISEEGKSILLKVTELFGSFDSLQEARKCVSNSRSLEAIDRLSRVYEVLCLYGVEKYVSFDLGMLSKYNYYTGIIFKAYTFGVGDAIIKGGRYDRLLSYFGKNAPAVGFMIIVDDVMVAISSQKIVLNNFNRTTLFVYNKECYKKALDMAVNLRSQGKNAEMICYDRNKSRDSYQEFGRNNLVSEVIFVESEEV